MSTYIKTHIHQLFPCPTNLTVVYEPGYEAQYVYDQEIAEIQAANPGIGTPERSEPAPYVLPVVAYALVDLITMRRKDDAEVSRRRVVEPLVAVQPCHADEFKTVGLQVLTDLDRSWRSPEGYESADYYYGGIYQDGKSIGSAPTCEASVFVP